MKTMTIHYSGQGYIYRCPNCQKVDRMPWNEVPDKAECRLCNKEFNPVEVTEMNDELYSVIQEINYLETGTVFGASEKDLRKSSLAKAGKSVGIDVVGDYVSKPIVPNNDIQAYFDSKKTKPNKLKELYKTEQGRELLEIAGSLLMKKETAKELAESDKPIYTEVLEEARMRQIMKHNPGLSLDEKKKILKQHGFNPFLEKRNGEITVCVFFASSYAPECDAYVYWIGDKWEE